MIIKINFKIEDLYFCKGFKPLLLLLHALGRDCNKYI